jgi:hypothetical protein
MSDGFLYNENIQLSNVVFLSLQLMDYSCGNTKNFLLGPAWSLSYRCNVMINKIAFRVWEGYFVSIALTEIRTRDLPSGKGRPAHKPDLTAICKPIVYKM